MGRIPECTAEGQKAMSQIAEWEVQKISTKVGGGIVQLHASQLSSD